jgi:predicted DCC family thiol-disulfide oxidoreductase YuxK
MAPSKRWTVLYDGSCAVCRRSVRGLRLLDRSGVCRLVDASDAEAARYAAPQVEASALAEALHVLDDQGRVYSGFGALRELMRIRTSGRLLRPWLFLPGVSWLGERIYSFLARHRHGVLG